MQGKGIVRFFTVLFLIVSLYQLLLLIPTTNVEREVANKAEQKVAALGAQGGQRDSLYNYYHQVFLDSAFSKPTKLLFLNWLPYKDLKKQQLDLGLDLKGGMNITLQVDLRDLIIRKALNEKSLEKVPSKAVTDALNRVREMQRNSSNDFISLFAQAYREVSNGQKLAVDFCCKNDNGLTENATDEQVIKYLTDEADKTIVTTYEKLKQRIDKFGVTSPNVTLDKRTERISVELAGVRNPERARSMLQASAKLEFLEIFTPQEASADMKRLDQVLRRLGTGVVPDTIGKPDSVKVAIMDSLTKAQPTDGNGPLFSLFRTNFVSDTMQGFASLALVDVGDTLTVARMLRNPEARLSLTKPFRFAWGKQPVDGTGHYELFALKPVPDGEDPLDGRYVTDANSQPSQQGGGYVVTMDFKDKGVDLWAKITGRNVGRPVAVVLDNQVCSAPRVNGAITGGNTEISGNFDSEGASDLSNILRIGELPAKTEIVEQAVVGASLGEETINAGLTSMLIALLVIVVFMIFYYNTAGVVAVIALLANLFFILATLSSLGMVLTLPSIAGIVLTMGMAVDANVVIYERVREELRLGKGLTESIHDGFKHSYSALIDANMTTLLTAIVLAVMGLGPIKGFGVVLAVGTVSTVFTAILVSHLIFDWWLGRGKTFKFSIPATEHILVGKNIDFVGMRKYAYIFSVAVIAIGIASYFVRGFELGIDFSGGRTYTVSFNSSVNTDELANTLATKSFVDESGRSFRPVIKAFGAGNQYKITTGYMVNSENAQTDSIVREKLRVGLASYLGKDLGPAEFTSMVTSENVVGPTVADDISKSAFYTAIVGLLAIFIYILFRFRRWQYSLGAVAATVHDMTIVITLFTLLHGILPFSLEIDQAFIAVVLTIIGYSVNDTVIVFDRLREYLNTYQDRPLRETVNAAINSTLSRTIITSATVFFVAVVLLIFGGDGIKAFSFAMTVGVVFGAYSSIFVATPIMMDLIKEKGPKVVGGLQTNEAAAPEKEKV